MIALISGAHDSISCLAASCALQTPEQKRRVPADGAEIERITRDFEAVLRETYMYLNEYTIKLDPENGMEYRSDENAFMKIFTVHNDRKRKRTPKGTYLRDIFDALRTVGVDLGDDSDTAWNPIVMWMYFVSFHISRVYEDDRGDPSENILAQWLTHGAMDLVDAYIVRAILKADTENVLLVVGSTHVDAVIELLSPPEDKTGPRVASG
ncbi:hypothetical protein CYMTET_2925 [Cymbomonas tetramitiformis]|uniref:Uncharacterized protein n=1 Tax=Cymbomonas tetramitiformis TaxID=36881 RepID=A0AAE0LLW7_9CHLO|nr:hypothetical protein CYMTET_2925 [Cymbomonas tetramitiformis]